MDEIMNVYKGSKKVSVNRGIELISVFAHLMF